MGRRPVPAPSLPDSLRDLVADQPPGHIPLLAVAWTTLQQYGRADLDRVTRILRQAQQETRAQDVGIPRWERSQRRLGTAQRRAVHAIEAYRDLRRELDPARERYGPDLLQRQERAYLEEVRAQDYPVLPTRAPNPTKGGRPRESLQWRALAALKQAGVPDGVRGWHRRFLSTRLPWAPPKLPRALLIAVGALEPPSA